MSPNSTCDLHLHTHYSDGRASPASLLRYAASIGLKTIAITDHDNLNALPEAARVAEQLGLELIPGIELTCRWDLADAQPGDPQARGDIDLLGYFIQIEDETIQVVANRAMMDLKERITECCDRLTQAGYPLTIFDVLDENPRYPGPVHLIQALRRKGHARSWAGAFSLFQQHWQYVRLSRQTIEENIAAIHSAGGAAVLAHPLSVRSGGERLQSGHIAALVDLGLDGLEVYHPRHDAEARRYFLDLAQQYDLVVTGGSDEHGWDGSFVRMGTEPISYRTVNELRERTKAARNM